jgi:hypothetical protein
MWVSNFYTADPGYMKLVVNYWVKFWPKAPQPRNKIPPFMPMLAADDYDPMTLRESEQRQRMARRCSSSVFFLLFIFCF